MRDILLTAVIGVLLLAIFKHPVIGAYLWAWLSLMNPHKLTYGFAQTLQFAYVCAVVTTLMLVMTKRRQAIPINSITVVHLTLLVWMTITSIFAIAPFETVVERWIFVMKIQVMMFVTLMLVTEAKQLRVLIWVVTFSVAFYGIKGGAFTLATGGAWRVWGPPGGLIEENNALAVALVMLTPIMYFLRQTEPRAWIRHVLMVCIILVTFSILGSQSRGALLALSAMAVFLGLKGMYRLRTSLALLVLVAIGIAFMPETWSTRMDTIQNYQEDQSAMSRLWTWQTLWNAALDRPFVGAGLQADSPEVFARYAPRTDEFAVFAGRVYVAHSIYFQMLGEHGFPGLALFLLLGALTWRMASRLAKQTKDDPELGSWMPMLMRMVQVSLVGFSVGGAFLSLAYFDIPYYYVIFVVLCNTLVAKRKRQTRPVVGARIDRAAAVNGPPASHAR